MIGIVYSTKDEVSASAARAIISEYGLENKGGSFANDRIAVKEIETELTCAEKADSFGFEVIFFLSKHSSAKGIPAFTTHATGNWAGKAELGGKPKELSTAAPASMLAVLASFGKLDVRIEKGYEATHHGPLLKTPSLFVELGGNDETRSNMELQRKLAVAAYESATLTADKEVDMAKVVIGIGGNHYPSKFSKLAMEKGYAFSHIMPKYAIMNDDSSDNLDMLEQTLARSANAPEAAVLEWKSVNSVVRNKILSRLNEIGLDYEKI